MKHKFLLLILLISTSVFADEGDIIYVYGYGELMQQALDNIGYLLENTNIFLKTAVAIGLVLTGYKSFLNPKANPVFVAVKTMSIVIIANGLFFYSNRGSNTYTYTIQDTSNNAIYRADGVPLGLGKMLTITSAFERAVTEGIERAFGSFDNDVNSFAKSGFLYPLKAKLMVNDLRIKDRGNVVKNVNKYFDDCLINAGGLSDKTFKRVLLGGIDELNKICATSTFRKGFLTTYANDEKDANTNMITGISEETMTCQQLCDNIVKDMNAMLTPNNINKNIGNELARHFLTGGFDNNREISKLNNFIKNWGEAIDDSSKAFKNSVMLNLFNDAFVSKAQLLGMNSKGSVFGLATAQMHAKQNFLISSSMAGEFLPEIKAIVHIIIVVMSLFIIMLSIMFMQPLFVKTFITLNLWITFWSPLLAIINFIMINKIEKIVEYVKSQGYDPFSVLGSDIIDGKILDYLAYEGTLAWLVPVLAFAIASGSAQGFVSFASSLGQQFASASMMGARQVTSMATSGSQSIRDGNRVFTKDGNGLSMRMSITDVPNSRPMDYLTRYDESTGKATQTAVSSADGSFIHRYGDNSTNQVQVDGVTANSIYSAMKSKATSLTNETMNSIARANNQQEVANILKGTGFSKEEAEGWAAKIAHAKQTQQSLNDSLAQSGITATSNGESIRFTDTTGHYVDIGLNKLGLGGGISKKLEETFGKEIANKITNELKKSTTDSHGKSISIGEDIANSASEMQKLQESVSANHQKSFGLSTTNSTSDTSKSSETLSDNTSSGGSISMNTLNSFFNKHFTSIEEKQQAISTMSNFVKNGDMKGLEDYLGGIANNRGVGGIGKGVEYKETFNPNNIYESNAKQVKENYNPHSDAKKSLDGKNERIEQIENVTSQYERFKDQQYVPGGAEYIPTNAYEKEQYDLLRQGKISENMYKANVSASNVLENGGSIQDAFKVKAKMLGMSDKDIQQTLDRYSKAGDKGDPLLSSHTFNTNYDSQFSNGDALIHKVEYWNKLSSAELKEENVMASKTAMNTLKNKMSQGGDYSNQFYSDEDIKDFDELKERVLGKGGGVNDTNYNNQRDDFRQKLNPKNLHKR